MFDDCFNRYTLLLSIVIIVLLFVLVVLPEKKDSFASIYLLNQDKKFGNYSGNVTIGITNNLGYGTEFTVFYKKDNSTLGSWDKELQSSKSWEFPVTLSNNSGNNIFELWYKQDGNWIYSNEFVSLSG